MKEYRIFETKNKRIYEVSTSENQESLKLSEKELFKSIDEDLKSEKKEKKKEKRIRLQGEPRYFSVVVSYDDNGKYAIKCDDEEQEFRTRSSLRKYLKRRLQPEQGKEKREAFNRLCAKIVILFVIYFFMFLALFFGVKWENFSSDIDVKQLIMIVKSISVNAFSLFVYCYITILLFSWVINRKIFFLPFPNVTRKRVKKTKDPAEIALNFFVFTGATVAFSECIKILVGKINDTEQYMAVIPNLFFILAVFLMVVAYFSNQVVGFLRLMANYIKFEKIDEGDNETKDGM